MLPPGAFLFGAVRVLRSLFRVRLSEHCSLARFYFNMSIARTRAELASRRAVRWEPLPDCLLAWRILDNYDEKRERLQYH